MGWILLQDWREARTWNSKKHTCGTEMLFFFQQPPQSMEFLWGNMDVAGTYVSLGTRRQSETHYISQSCGHTAVFLVPLGVTRLCCHALLLFTFLFRQFWKCHLIPRAWWLHRNLLVWASVSQTRTAFDATESTLSTDRWKAFALKPKLISNQFI